MTADDPLVRLAREVSMIRGMAAAARRGLKGYHGRPEFRLGVSEKLGEIEDIAATLEGWTKETRARDAGEPHPQRGRSWGTPPTE